MSKIASWGNLNTSKHRVVELDQQKLMDCPFSESPGIAYGMGRSYGDACLNPNGTLWKTRHLDRFIHFDSHSGCLTCEPGVLLKEIQQLFIPQGWMLPVSPGTQEVTVGGAIANDIHGKNHFKAGSFGHHILQLELLRTDGERLVCSPTKNADWFAATIGGAGLTGFIGQAKIQLQKVKGPWFSVEKIPFTSLTQCFELMQSAVKNWEYTLAWLDYGTKGCRGIFMQANPLQENNSPSSIKNHPISFLPPVSLINKWTLKALNSCYFELQKKQTGLQPMHYASFFYPLDTLQNWNRLYGPKGFYQYQCVIPTSSGKDAIDELLQVIAHSNIQSGLSVLKTFGPISSQGMLSFPMEGLSLALDFPNQGQKTKDLFQRLDAIVAEAKGRLYLAKDARMSKSFFEASYPRLSEFKAYHDVGMSSALSRRLMGF